MSGTYQTTARSTAGQSSEKLVYSAAEAAKELDISISTLRRLTREGAIPCKRIGRSVRYPIDTLRAFVNDVNSGSES